MKTVTLCIGHSSKESGAEASDGKTTEYLFNKILVGVVADELKKKGVKTHIVNRLTDGNGTGMTADIRAVNKYETDCIVEFHCNAYDGATEGCEMLHWHSSTKGKKLAEYVQKAVCKALGNDDRGLKPIKAKGRGAAVLRGSIEPMIIAEPFFIDNPNDFHNALNRYAELVKAYADGIYRFLEETNA